MQRFRGVRPLSGVVVFPAQGLADGSIRLYQLHNVFYAWINYPTEARDVPSRRGYGWLRLALRNGG